jgi:gliding motility-associated-like protein
MKLKIFLFFLLFSSSLLAQKQANVWVFGTGDVLDFNPGNPIGYSGIPMYTQEGSASICDSAGNLMFYTNGGGRETFPSSVNNDPGHIWNRNFNVMYNMQGIEGGGFSAIQSAVIFKKPGEDKKYYVFTMEEYEDTVSASASVIAVQPNGRGLSYFVVDMTLNNGLGGVVQADERVFAPSFEGLCAIRHQNGDDYWILAHRDTLGIGVYKVDGAGISLHSIVSLDVPVFSNPSFETLACIPDSISEIACAADWFRGTIDGTPDFFVDTPGGLWSNVIPQPLPDGNALAGLVISSGVSEYVATSLPSPIEAGIVYHLKMKLAGTSVCNSTDTSITGSIGAFYGPVDITIYGSPDIVTTPVTTTFGGGCPAGSGNWTALGHASYAANGNWQDLEITFQATSNIQTIMIGAPCTLPPYMTPNVSANGACYPYFFIDKLSLSTNINSYGAIKASPDGRHVYCGNRLLQFDPSTGILSNQLNMPLGTAAEFSPNSQYLYTYRPLTNGSYNTIQQFNLTSSNILGSEMVVDSVATDYYFNSIPMQLAPDGKIYFVGIDFSTQNNIVSRIACTNTNSPSLEENVYVYPIDPAINNINWFNGLPNFPAWIFENENATSVVISEDTVCYYGTPITVTAQTPSTDILWSTGDTTASIVINAPGTYTVNVLGNCGSGNDKVVVKNCVLPIDSCLLFQANSQQIQTFTVPPGVDSIRVKMWGAAGGAGPDNTGNKGGGGGFTNFVMAVTPGEVLEITVGSGGKAASGHTGGAGGWPGGGIGGSGTLVETILGVPTDVGGAGGGGGATYIRRQSNNTLLAVAGSGGGGAFNRMGGSGGGLEAGFTVATNATIFDQFGFGGTQTSGGAPSNNTLSPHPVMGTAGSALNGGNGGSDPTTPFSKGGGGGGSGYYGGGGGGTYDANGFGSGSTGGGGSGYVCTTCGLIGQTIIDAETGGIPANENDPLLLQFPLVGRGIDGEDGGDGLVQICIKNFGCITTSSSISPIACTTYTSPSGKVYIQSGLYIDTLVNAAGCDSIINITLSITGLPTATATSTPGTCGLSNGTASVTASGGSGTYTYAWSNGATGIFNTSLGEGSYTVTATDQNGCSAQAQVNVAAIPPVNVLVTASDTLIQYGDSVNLSVQNGVDYTWTPATGLSCSNCSTPIAKPLKNTTYFVTGKDTNGCAYSRSVTIVVEIICNELFVPDIFSPNGMGNPENEKLCVYSNCIKEMTFGIYNRWGELIFLTNDVNACWDGTHKGSEAITGTYVYRLYVEQLDGQKIESAGNITLIR